MFPSVLLNNKIQHLCHEDCFHLSSGTVQLFVFLYSTILQQEHSVSRSALYFLTCRFPFHSNVGESQSSETQLNLIMIVMRSSLKLIVKSLSMEDSRSGCRSGYREEKLLQADGVSSEFPDPETLVMDTRMTLLVGTEARPAIYCGRHTAGHLGSVKILKAARMATYTPPLPSLLLLSYTFFLYH